MMANNNIRFKEKIENPHILWVSVGNHRNSGYGIISKYVTEYLISKNIDIITTNKDIFEPITYNNVMQLPRGNSELFIDILEEYVINFKRNVMISNIDVWAIPTLYKEPLNKIWIPYVPIDSPITNCYKYINLFKQAKHIITMSKFGYEQLKQYIDVSKLSYIPVGVDTEIFKPVDKINKEKIKFNLFNLPSDAFLFGYVAQNIGMRKGLPELIKTFSKVSKLHKNAYLYLHTNPNGILSKLYGFDLIDIINKYDVKDKVIMPVNDIFRYPFPMDLMNKIYNAMDVYVSNSAGEGFGMPILEAMSSGIPVIAGKHSAQTELVLNNGWLVKANDYHILNIVPTSQEYAYPNNNHMFKIMNYVIDNPDAIIKKSSRSRQFALKYDWNKFILPKWHKFITNLNSLDD